MNRRGQPGWARWGVAILIGWVVVTGVHAQQTHGSDDDNQGGFVVIEESPTPAPPPPVSLPATTKPVAVPTGNAASYKPGTAVYEIPYAKPGAPAASSSSSTAVATTGLKTSPASTAPSVSAPATVTGAGKPLAPVQTTATAAAPPVAPKPVWHAPAGQTLRSVLATWSAHAGWTTPIWDKNLDAVDYAIPADITLTGTLEDAVRALMRPFGHATPALKADIWDGNGQHVINIEEKK